jgi:hypothetical protein
MVAQAQFSTSDLEVQPGEMQTLSLTVTNLGSHTETFTLVPAGLVAGWVRLTPPVVTLFGGSSEVVTVTLRPPLLASTAAGPAPLTVRIIPQDEPDEVTVVESTVRVGAFHDRRIQALQPVLRGNRRATFDFLIENHGNEQASCRLHLIDTTQRLDGDFDPPAAGIEPGAKSLVRLRLKALHRQWRSHSRTLAFSIEADQQGFPTASAQATFVQTPFVPEGIGRRFVGAIAVVAVVALAWFALLRPVVQHAAKSAVRSNAPVATATTLLGQGTQSSLASDSSTPVNNDPKLNGVEPFNQRLELKVAPSASGSGDYVVPAGKVLRITDVMLQNPNLDTGPASLSANDQVLIPWRLENSTGNESLPLVSPLVFKAGDKVTFTFTCSSVGDAPTGACVPAVLLSGTLANN